MDGRGPRRGQTSDDRVMPSEASQRGLSVGREVWWCSILLLGVFVYLHHLGGEYIPRIGDESPYIQIARLTAESGHWLPLRASPGLENTKPPFLFWLGIVSTDWGRRWSLWYLRLPVVAVTLLTAALVFLLARRFSGRRECGYLAALTLLGCRSTFQYGRPFLINLPETLFAFAPFALYVGWRKRFERWGLGAWALGGVLLGVACLFKSFMLVVPVGLAFFLVLLLERKGDVAAFVRHDAFKLSAMLFVALLCFSLWPALDPDPMSVLRNFIYKENLGKLGGSGYWRGLVMGPYALHRIWLAPFASAGPFALPLLYVVVHCVRRWRDLAFEERALWLLPLSFLIVYSIPRQRQENYLLPIVPALAVLVALNWKRLPRRWLQVAYVPLVLAVVVLCRLLAEVSQGIPDEKGYMLWQLGVPAVALLVTLGGLFLSRLRPYLFHLSALLAMLSVTSWLAPFDGAAGRFDRKHAARLAGKTVYVPSDFVAKVERYRFLLPRSRIQGYDPKDTERINALLGSRRYVAVHRALGQPLGGPYRVFASRLDLRGRQSFDEMWRIVFGGELDLLVRRELVIRRRAVKRERAETIQGGGREGSRGGSSLHPRSDREGGTEFPSSWGLESRRIAIICNR